MEFTSLLKKITSHYQDKKAFVAYSSPHSAQLIAWLSKTATSKDSCFSSESFIFAPFSKTKKKQCLFKSEADTFEAQINPGEYSNLTVTVPFQDAHKQQHMDLVTKAIGNIKTGETAKIVVSRCKNIELKTLNIASLFHRLLLLYPTAFRYLWYHPDTGLWCGATPELLLQVNGAQFATVALAGTKKRDSLQPVNWTEKEQQEQQFVTDDVVKRLAEISLNIETSLPYIERAGDLLHIKTDITGVLQPQITSAERMIDLLHPTPAVCGTPRDASRQFIKQEEGYDRTFYTGYLGIHATSKGNSQFYVNLRCMKIEDKIASIYVGGGITEASSPQQEWQETEDKLQTMLEVLKPFL